MKTINERQQQVINFAKDNGMQGEVVKLGPNKFGVEVSGKYMNGRQRYEDYISAALDYIAAMSNL